MTCWMTRLVVWLSTAPLLSRECSFFTVSWKVISVRFSPGMPFITRPEPSDSEDSSRIRIT